jgi:hypothetical protein
MQVLIVGSLTATFLVTGSKTVVIFFLSKLLRTSASASASASVSTSASTPASSASMASQDTKPPTIQFTTVEALFELINRVPGDILIVTGISAQLYISLLVIILIIFRGLLSRFCHN